MAHNLAPISALRRENVLFLLKYHDISRQELCETIGMGYTQINAYLRPNNCKTIGNKISAKFEQAFSLEAGALDRDLSKEFPVKEEDSETKSTPTPTPSVLPKLENKTFDSGVISVPLFISNKGTGRLSVKKEPYLEGTLIKLSDVYHQGIQPNDVMAFKVFGQVEHIPHKSTVFLDSSIDSVDLPNAFYLVGIDGERKVMQLNSNDEVEGSLILGRLFHVEYSL